MATKKYSISKIINENSETLFEIVSDFANYPKWNTLIPQAKGELIEGTKLELMMKMDGKTRPFNPSVARVEMNKKFVLSKVFLSKRIGELTHQFEFKELANNQTEFIQTWEGKGMLLKLMWSKIEQGFSEFETFNEDLNRFVNKS